MTDAYGLPCGYIKIEDTPSPDPVVEEPSIEVPEPEWASANNPPAPVIDPRDPEGFLRRCSGYNKKSKLRCNTAIGKKSEQSCHPTYLPTCKSHRDQKSHAGWCQFKHPNGERCGRLFRYKPPHFELCAEHEGHPDTPCYFFNLPLELRHEVFRYLLPSRPIGSSTAVLHDEDTVNHQYFNPLIAVGSQLPPNLQTINLHRRNGQAPYLSCVSSSQTGAPESVFPMPALDLLLVSRQFYIEAKDLLFSTVPFTIDVRKDGTFMCGRRLLEPRRADGSSHFQVDEADEAKQRFLKFFEWSAVKHYIVNILVENWMSGPLHAGSNHMWDEEVELYDIRDYISVVVSGVLAQSKNLCKLQVRLCLADFTWDHAETLTNTKLLVGPFERLRNVRQPQILGVSMGKPNHNSMLIVQRPAHSRGSRAPICSVPPLPLHTPVLGPGMPDFDAYAADWSRWISSSSSAAVTKKPAIRNMFTAFKDFYTELSAVVPCVTYVRGRQAFLHRARVAREREDVEAFRCLRNDLIQHWYTYLEHEEWKKDDMNKRMSRMLESDIYPSNKWDDAPPTRRSSEVKSPEGLDDGVMAKEGIPMAANPSLHPAVQQMQMQRTAAQHRAMCQQMGIDPTLGQAQRNAMQQAFMRQQQQAAMHPQHQMGMAAGLPGNVPVMHNGQIALMRQQAQQQAQQHQQQAQQQMHVQQHPQQQTQQQMQLQMLAQQQAQQRTALLQQLDQMAGQAPESAATSEELESGHPDTLMTDIAPDAESSSDSALDAVDVECFQHVNLTADWLVDDGEAGPSRKRKRKERVDWGCVDGDKDDVAESNGDSSGVDMEIVESAYVGKGKGRMRMDGEVEVKREVICID